MREERKAGRPERTTPAGNGDRVNAGGFSADRWFVIGLCLVLVLVLALVLVWELTLVLAWELVSVLVLAVVAMQYTRMNSACLGHRSHCAQLGKNSLPYLLGIASTACLRTPACANP